MRVDRHSRSDCEKRAGGWSGLASEMSWPSPVWAASPADEWMSQTRKPAVPVGIGARPTNTVVAGLTWRSVGGGFTTSTTEIFLCEVHGESRIYHNRRRPPPAGV